MFTYIKGYLSADTKGLRAEASKSARAWLIANGYANGRHWTDSYRAEFAAYTRSFINERLRQAGTSAVKAKG